jgi:hypothetical protein
MLAFRAIDEHFRITRFSRNLPALMGLLALQYNGSLGAQTLLPGNQYQRFPAYREPLMMESNGKHVTFDRTPIVGTGPLYRAPALASAASGTAPSRLRCPFRLFVPRSNTPKEFIPNFSVALCPI